jgi:hypothetical protein
LNENYESKLKVSSFNSKTEFSTSYFICWKVSFASLRVASIIPTGPLFAQPATYMPGIVPDLSRILPLIFGMMCLFSSKGTPDIGADW